MAAVVQDRVIFHRLENICQCVERGEWPGGHRYGGSLLNAMDSHSSTPVPGTPTSTPLPMDSASSAASALERLVSGLCEEVTVSVGFDLFRLRKQNKRNFNDIVLHDFKAVNMLSVSEE